MKGGVGEREYVRNVPPAADLAARKAWLKQRWERRHGDEANKFPRRPRRVVWRWRRKAVRFAETFEDLRVRPPADEGRVTDAVSVLRGKETRGNELGTP